MLRLLDGVPHMRAYIRQPGHSLPRGLVWADAAVRNAECSDMAGWKDSMDGIQILVAGDRREGDLRNKLRDRCKEILKHLLAAREWSGWIAREEVADEYVTFGEECETCAGQWGATAGEELDADGFEVLDAGEEGDDGMGGALCSKCGRQDAECSCIAGQVDGEENERSWNDEDEEVEGLWGATVEEELGDDGNEGIEAEENIDDGMEGALCSNCGGQDVECLCHTVQIAGEELEVNCDNCKKFVADCECALDNREVGREGTTMPRASGGTWASQRGQGRGELMSKIVARIQKATNADFETVVRAYLDADRDEGATIATLGFAGGQQGSAGEGEQDVDRERYDCDRQECTRHLRGRARAPSPNRGERQHNDVLWGAFFGGDLTQICEDMWNIVRLREGRSEKLRAMVRRMIKRDEKGEQRLPLRVVGVFEAALAQGQLKESDLMLIGEGLVEHWRITLLGEQTKRGTTTVSATSRGREGTRSCLRTPVPERGAMTVDKVDEVDRKDSDSGNGRGGDIGRREPAGCGGPRRDPGKVRFALSLPPQSDAGKGAAPAAAKDLRS
eukprot:gene2914-3012_t